MRSPINDQFDSRTNRKTTGIAKKTWRCDFVSQQYFVLHEKPVKDTLKPLGWNRSTTQTWRHLSHLFASMVHVLVDRHFSSSEEFVKCLKNDLPQRQFFWHGIHKLRDRWSNCIETDGQYLNKNKLISLKDYVYFLYKKSGKPMH